MSVERSLAEARRLCDLLQNRLAGMFYAGSSQVTALDNGDEMNRLSGKIVLVTGASKGIGAGIVKRLGADEATVVVNFVSSREGADRTVEEIVINGGQAWTVQGDFSQPPEITRTFAEIEQTHGRRDVLVNNAGVAASGRLESVTAEQFHRLF